MLKVMTTCLVTGRPIETHAVMTAQQFERLTGSLAVYCSACGEPHLVARERLWLEGVDDPPNAKPSHAARGRRTSGVGG